MASVCGGTLALMDAGVPILRPVAGISIGMVSKGDDTMYLTDIVGDEDHFGDMDFKVAGTQKGITGIQLDLKMRAVSLDVIRETFKRAGEARLHILREMLGTLDRPRAQISRYAPRILTVRIPVDKIGKLIGPGGKGIKKIEADTGAKVEIEDDGTVYISSINADSAEQARDMVECVAEELKVGKIYNGRVSTVKDFGAFIEVVPGQDGLCHISELDHEYVRSVDDICKVGDSVRVKVIGIDEHGRVKLSRKAAMADDNAGGDKADRKNPEPAKA
jgi:polyribonucleotide nucleotidyltransferase